MPLQSLNFGSTHSWDDHRTVKNAVDEINRLPKYSSGGISLGSSFTLGYIEQLISSETSAIQSAQKRIDQQCRDGFSDEQIKASRDYKSGLESYKSALETIRDYMKSYSGRCGCG